MGRPLSHAARHFEGSAVFVKGSNAANVYYYGPNGTLSDSGLSAPTNASGKPVGLSNLIFCFIECNPMVIAFLVTLGETSK